MSQKFIDIKKNLYVYFFSILLEFNLTKNEYTAALTKLLFRVHHYNAFSSFLQLSAPRLR